MHSVFERGRYFRRNLGWFICFRLADDRVPVYGDYVHIEFEMEDDTCIAGPFTSAGSMQNWWSDFVAR